MQEGGVLRAWSYSTLAIAALLLAFMLYLLPLPPLIPQDYRDRILVSQVAHAFFATGIVGFGLISLADRPPHGASFLRLVGLQGLAAVLALFASGWVEFGA